MSLYRRSDVFVYPSMYPEGLPTSILEAALGDCAIIATPRGGTEEVITSPALGWIVDGASSAQLRTPSYPPCAKPSPTPCAAPPVPQPSGRACASTSPGRRWHAKSPPSSTRPWRARRDRHPRGALSYVLKLGRVHS